MITLLIILILGGVYFYFFYGKKEETPDKIFVSINSFDSCAKAGNPVMESFPRQCKTSDGRTFVEDIGNALEKQNFIKLTSPRPNDVVKSPLLVEGEARGTWYFEASFPITLMDSNGKVLARAPADAQSNWMTENFVPFKAGLKFDPPDTDTGFLILEKDNPSGLQKNADALKIPVKFK